VKRAARLGDAWLINPHATIDTIRRQVGVYRTELKASGKAEPRELPMIKEVFCARNRAAALEMAAPYLLAKYRDYAKWGQDKVMPDNEDFTRSFEDLIKDRFILGSPDDCYDQLKPYWEEFGVNHIVIRTHWAGMPLSLALASIRLISDALLPALQKI
jgi:alkanesulfonate monooxygenase SsuD/methylene tetrahydromethanopterin reductase-like flavin-dependent oxidoreductase (luciferase family)